MTSSSTPTDTSATDTVATQTPATQTPATQTAIVPAALALADGSIFEGEHIGVKPTNGFSSGEVVFNTAMSGYQEILTDPSYAGQIITFTYPHIGNYGVTSNDSQSRGIFTRGVIVRELSRRASSWRSEDTLQQFFQDQQISGLAGIDTRRLTRLLRDTGSLPGAFGPIQGDGAVDLEKLKRAAKDEPGTDGVDLVSEVTTAKTYRIEYQPNLADGSAADRANPPHVIAYDFGVKTSILGYLREIGNVTVVPANTTAAEVLALKPDGVFLSNGPGDPTVPIYAIKNVKELVGQVPIFGICLGHQILSLAIGGEIEKLTFGHHGANHPVQEVATGTVEITSQNHNFATVATSVADVANVTHLNLNDGVCQGLRLRDGTAFSVQHHPEANPGPADSAHIFKQFEQLIEGAA